MLSLPSQTKQTLLFKSCKQKLQIGNWTGAVNPGLNSETRIGFFVTKEGRLNAHQNNKNAKFQFGFVPRNYETTN